MSEDNMEKIVEFSLDPNNPPEISKEELERLDAMTDEEVEAAALSDPDCPPCTDEELSQFQPVNRHLAKEPVHFVLSLS